MPNPEQQPNQPEPVISEMLVKQDQLLTKLDQLAELVRQQSTNVLHQLRDQEEKISAVETRLDSLENSVKQGFALCNQRLTDLFTLLGRKLN